MALATALATGVVIHVLANKDAGNAKAAADANKTPASATDLRTLRFSQDAPQLAYVHIEQVDEVAEPVSDPLAGRITYDEDVTARVSSPIAGRVVRLQAKPGDSVKAGQPLLWLDSPDYGAAVADLQKADAGLRQKDQAYQRAKTLFEGQVLARKDLEATEADLAQARAEYARAKGRMKNLTLVDPHGADSTFMLRAPISGMVVDRQVNPGTEVRPDAPNPLFVITDPAHLWVVVDLSERELGKVHRGQAVRVEADAYPGLFLETRIDAVGEVLDPATRKIQARCLLANPKFNLKPEMFARVTLLSDSNSKVIQIPNTALITEGLHHYVFVEKAPGELEKRPVTLSHQGQETSVVADGLTAGTRIATRGALLLNSELAGGEK